MAWKTDADGVVQYDDTLYWKLALPGVAILIHVCVGAAFLAPALMHARLSPGGTLGALAMGFLLWTLFEYLVHRWAFHQTGHPVLRWLYKHCHMPHHRAGRMDDDNHRALHPAIGIPALLPHYLLGLWLGADGYLAGTVGFMLGYCTYELIHYLFHGTEFPHRFNHLGWVRRRYQAHRVHHFGNAQRNFGFTLLVWDALFGTLDLDDRRVRAQDRRPGSREKQPLAVAPGA